MCLLNLKYVPVLFAVVGVALVWSRPACAEPVYVTVTGECPVAELAEDTDQELRVVGFEPATDEEASVELHIRRTCEGVFLITVRDTRRDLVVRERLTDVTRADAVLHAVELLRATSQTGTEPPARSKRKAKKVRAEEEPAEMCAVEPTTIELAPEDAAGMAELEAWEMQSTRPEIVHPKCRRACRDKGRCRRVDNTCIADGDTGCFWSKGCRDEGRCREVAGLCLATQERDCRRSRVCRERGHCGIEEEEHRCVDVRKRRDRKIMALGITGVSISGVSTFAGVVHLALTHNKWSDPVEPESPVPGIALLAVGIPGIVTSLAGLLYGAEKLAPDDVAPEEGASVLPTVHVAPTGASLSWRF